MRVIDWPNKPRDPKVDPRPGDVLEDSGGLRLSVSAIGLRGRVLIQASVGGVFMNATYSNEIGQWRKWSATAEVIHVAEPK